MNSPVSRDEILRAFGATFTRPENKRQHAIKPRASSLGHCARQQAYDMCATVPDAIGVTGSRLTYDSDLTSEQGRAFEGLMERTLSTMGIDVENSQNELPSTYCVSGHPDGELNLSRYLERQSTHNEGDATKWGVEFKHLGRFGYTKTIRQGIRNAHPQYVLQGALYGDALGWDAILYIVSSQDASSIRADAAQSLRYKTPVARWAETLTDWDPKLHVEAVSMKEPDIDALLSIARVRAQWLSDWKVNDGNPAHVAPEYNVSADKFPCTYCPFLTTCINDGDGGYRAPELPFRMDN